MKKFNKNILELFKTKIIQKNNKYKLYLIVILISIIFFQIFIIHNYREKLFYFTNIVNQSEHFYEGKKLPLTEICFPKSKKRYYFIIFVNGNDCNKCLRLINKKTQKIAKNKFNILYIYSNSQDNIPSLSKYKNVFNIEYPVIADSLNIIQKIFNSHVAPICVVTNRKFDIIYVHKPSWKYPVKTEEFFNKISNL